MLSPRRSGAVSDARHRKSSLSAGRQQLVARMGALGFGRILNLKVSDGQPVFDRDTVVVRLLKMGGRNAPRPECGHVDFLLKDAVVELFAHLDRIGDGVIARVEIAHGLPLLIEVSEQMVP